MRGFVHLLCALGCAACAAPQASHRALQTRSEPAGVISLDMSQGPPLAHLSIDGGEPVVAIFDTGSDGSVLTLEFARRLHLPEEGPDYVVSPLGGPRIEGFRTTVRHALVEGVAMAPFAASAVPIDLGGASAVISPAAFAGRLVTIDFGGARIVLSTPGPAPPPGVQSAYGADGLPTIAVSIGGQNLTGHLDTGAPGALTLPLAQAAGLPLASPPRKIARAQSAGADLDIYSAQLDGDVIVGPLTLHNPEIQFFDTDTQAVNVGMQLLRQMTITLDPARRLVWSERRGGEVR